jgi:hypothetical protein
MDTLNDRHEIFQPYTASCSRCSQGFDLITFTCKAFSEGIPDKILAGKNKHQVPVKGQVNDLIFSTKK